ncbi:MAG: hypothetical protein U1E84_09230 [Rhodoferax sp.]
MGVSISHKRCWMALAVVLGVVVPVVNAMADDSDSGINSCLKAWGKHPFGKNPSYKTLSTSVKVFGIGKDTSDSEETSTPSLVMVNPGVNVAGGKTVKVLNPNGWYCFRTTVSVMGGMTIQAHCKAHLATTSGEVMGTAKDAEGKGVTVLGSTQVERIGCD